MAASGTTKKITTNQILGAGGTANLASVTVTGAATAARLIVTGSTIPANGVYLPAANTVGFAANSLDQYRIEPLGIFTWYDGAGGTRMTLNSTGLGLGVSPSYKVHSVVTSGYAGAFRSSTGVVGGILAGNSVADLIVGVDASGNGRLTADTSKYLGLGSGGINDRVILDSAGNFVVGIAAVATTATDGFLYVTGCAGTPTGTPTAKTGRVPIVVDTTNNKLYFYSGGSWVAAN
jgi:hypothetical protein